MKAIVSRIAKNRVNLLWDQKNISAILSGKLLRTNKLILGDIVEFKNEHNQNIITNIYKRKNELIRPRVANIDQIFIIMSIKKPDFDHNLVSRLIIFFQYYKLDPIILMSKIDLASNAEIDDIIKIYEKNKIKVIPYSKDDINPLKALFKDKISILCGQSGVGKSSLINAIDPNLNLKTNDISNALSRGKHTTTHNELYELAGGLIGDTPGFSSIDIFNLDINKVAHELNFIKDFALGCKFNDCKHDKEIDCNVKKALKDNRFAKPLYDNYLYLLKGGKKNV